MVVSQFRKQMCDNIQKDVSLMLVSKLIDRCKETVSTLNKGVTECKQEMLQSLNKEQATRIISRCEKLKTQESKKPNHTKSKKWAKLNKQSKPTEKNYEVCKCSLKTKDTMYNSFILVRVSTRVC